MAKLPLEGLRVVALPVVFAGPFGTMLLADLGAEVIKIVPPNTPFPSPIECEENKWVVYDAHLRNKKSLALNLRDEDARQVFYKLVAEADVILEGFRPGVVKRLGVDYCHFYMVLASYKLLSRTLRFNRFCFGLHTSVWPCIIDC